MSEVQSTLKNQKRYATDEERSAAIKEAKRRWEKKNRDAGLCKCGNQRNFSDGKLCMRCTVANRERCKRNATMRKQRMRGKGLCICGQSPRPGAKRCEKCLNMNKEGVRKALARRKKDGRCMRCGGESPRVDGKLSCAKCLAKQVEVMRRPRHLVFAAYGGYKCACCGETEYEFLTIDHINNDGAAHRRQVGSRGIYSDIVKRGFPPGFQVLCMNCNWGKRRHGVCPHKLKCEGSNPSQQDAICNA